MAKANVETVETVQAVEGVEVEAVKTYIVKCPNKDYVGVNAGGVQFAYGQAEVNEGWVLDWYKEHGYEVEEKK
ncbi:MAG: hypothetical protein WBI17_09790 [Clostridiaceae bacterium]